MNYSKLDFEYLKTCQQSNFSSFSFLFNSPFLLNVILSDIYIYFIPSRTHILGKLNVKHLRLKEINRLTGC